MSVRVAVAGATGYAGGELLRLLLGHAGVEIGAVTAGASAGSRLGDHHPHLWPLRDREIAATTPEALAGHDVVALALPHGASAEIASALPDDVLVLDCGADFRLRDAVDWERFYGSPHAGTWPYGLPELPGTRERLAGARRVAVPGCNVTAVTLAVLPAVADGLVDAGDLVVTAAVGPSGAGKAAKSHLLGSELMGSATPYGVGGTHRHVPEIRQNLVALGATAPRVSFTPVLVPTPRGILASCSAPLRDVDLDEATLRRSYADHYDAEPFVHLLPAGRWPQTQYVTGANTCQVQVTIDRDAGRVVMIAALDNLVKGTAGQAVQCLNLALGLPETTGLDLIGVAP